jgi:H+/Cl- antiporter ClcA
LLLLVLLVGTDYLGLGTPLIGKSFHSGGVESGAFAWKILFTAITLGTGFKGGEVTPLFCIGATLGCVFATFLGLPADLFAALGLAAVFAAAANTPLACVLMGVELYGGKMLLPLLIACVVAYQCSGTRSIYTTQREDIPKGDPHAQRGV